MTELHRVYAELFLRFANEVRPAASRLQRRTVRATAATTRGRRPSPASVLSLIDRGSRRACQSVPRTIIPQMPADRYTTTPALPVAAAGMTPPSLPRVLWSCGRRVWWDSPPFEWETAQPRNTMAFPSIWDVFRARICNELQARNGMIVRITRRGGYLRGADSRL